MDSVKMTRLPPLDIRFEVGGISEPPERSWARIRTYLIDNPKDDGLPRRQEIWSYHKKNRGVLKSIVKSLPNVPFRVRKKQVLNRRPRETSVNRIGDSGRALPKIQTVEKQQTGKNGRLRPLGALCKSEEISVSEKDLLHSTRETGADSTVDFRGESLPPLPPLPSKNEALQDSKRVSFSMNDIRENRSDSRRTVVSSASSAVSETVVGNYGPSSQSTTAPSIPRSLLDIIQGSPLADARVLRDLPISSIPKKQTASVNAGKTASTTVFPASEQERQWLENVVGEREVIDVSLYDNFARAPRPKPEVESRSPYVNPPIPERKPPRASVTINSNTPRVVAEVPSERKVVKPQPQTEQVVQKRPLTLAEKIQSVGNVQRQAVKPLPETQTPSQILPKVNSQRTPLPQPPSNNNSRKDNARGKAETPEVAKSPILGNDILTRDARFVSKSQSPPDSSSPRIIGEPIAPSPVINAPVGQRYFPVFSSDGSPMRKIGGPKKRALKISFPNSVPDATPMQ